MDTPESPALLFLKFFSIPNLVFHNFPKFLFWPFPEALVASWPCSKVSLGNSKFSNYFSQISILSCKMWVYSLWFKKCNLQFFASQFVFLVLFTCSIFFHLDPVQGFKKYIFFLTFFLAPVWRKIYRNYQFEKLRISFSRHVWHWRSLWVEFLKKKIFYFWFLGLLLEPLS